MQTFETIRNRLKIVVDDYSKSFHYCPIRFSYSIPIAPIAIRIATENSDIKLSLQSNTASQPSGAVAKLATDNNCGLSVIFVNQENW